MSLRLDRSGMYILCGAIDCGERLGLHAETLPLLWPGYRRDPDGVFRFTKHAQDRYRRGLIPRSHPRGWVPDWTTDPGETVPSALIYVVPCCLPFRAKCPDCGMVQEGTAEGLGIEPRPHPAGLDHHEDKTLSRDWLERLPGVL